MFGRRTVCLLLALGACGCDQRKFDLFVRLDAELPDTHGSDAAEPEPDAAEPEPDAAELEPDASAPEPDAGEKDASEPEDAGTTSRCPTATSISVGTRHTCAIAPDQTLWCWGDNEYGQLGTGTTFDEPLPAQIGVERDWIQVSSGWPMTCGIRGAGTLWCWGEEAEGWASLTPTELVPGTLWIDVKVAEQHACAIQDDLSLWCWGYGYNGKLGLGDFVNRMLPDHVMPGSAWRDVSGGGNHSCGIQNDGTLWCWGRDRHAELGLGVPINGGDHPSPVQTSTDTDWKKVELGHINSCAIRQDDSLWCFGAHYSGELGIGPPIPVQVDRPTRIGGSKLWRDIAPGEDHTCGLELDGTLYCWGAGDEGQIGIGVSGIGSRAVLFPTPATTTQTWIEVSSSTQHAGPTLDTGSRTCAIDTSNEIYCWGQNMGIEVWDGSTSDRSFPTRICD